MDLLFEDRFGKQRVIATVENELECWEQIKEFCAKQKYEIPYTRSWYDESGNIWFDLGSHNEFFILRKGE